MTTFWASPVPVAAAAAFYRRTYGARYSLHPEVDTDADVILSGFAPGQTANVRVEITTNRPDARLRDEQPATPHAIPPNTRSYSQVTVSSR